MNQHVPTVLILVGAALLAFGAHIQDETTITTGAALAFAGGGIKVARPVKKESKE